ncbi:MAG: anaerobic ribonucleoside-triphosphate reductase activating protein [Spirochaetales bacterium]|nr:anaerobic ribonucleoside-triphosphate reductase activating protein [Spirochaetales bacterium]
MIFGGFQKTDLINYPGYVASTVFTRGCNFRCPYCHNPEFVIQGSDQTYFGETYTEEEILSYLEKRRGMLDGLVVSGGEPTLHQDLTAFIRKVKALGLKVKLDTNGSRPEVLRLLLDDGLLDYVAMDIKAPLEKYSLVGFDDTDALRSSIAMLESSGVDHEYRTTCPKGILKPEDFPLMAALIGPSARWYLQTFNPSKTLDPAYNNESSYSEDELNGIIESYSLSNAKVR